MTDRYFHPQSAMRRRDRDAASADRSHSSREWRRSVEREVDEELSFHREMLVRDLTQTGLSRADAERIARERMGNVDAVTAECRRYGTERDRRERRAEVRAELRQDAAYAVRQLRRAPGFAAVVVLTLALGIGATAAVFSALYAVALRPLPFDRPERVVNLFSTTRGKYQGASPVEFAALHEPSHSFQHVAAAVLGAGISFAQGPTPDIISSARVSAEYFAVFGARPELGRTFRADEDAPGAAAVVIVSHHFWKNRLSSDSGIVGRTIRLGGAPYTVIGVMPRSFDVTKDAADVWVPLALSSDDLHRVGGHYLNLVARLRPNVTAEQARTEATAVLRAAVASLPTFHGNPSDVGVDVKRFIDDLVGDYRRSLFILFGAVSFVLLIACTNVANLLLARGTVRARELAIRAALGAGKARLVRQLLTECAVVSAAGVVVGLGLAYAMLRGILAMSPPDVPRLDQAGITGAVLAFTIAAGALSTLIFGMVPAVRAAAGALQQRLREGGRGLVSAQHERIRGAFVAVEVALAMTLLTGAVLLIRSQWRVQHVAPGFDPRGVLTARILLPATSYTTPARIVSTFERIRLEASAVPGVRSAALISVVPLAHDNMQSSVEAEDRPAEPGHAPTANLRLTSPGYFATMGIPLLAGRDLASTDVAGSARVVVINETLAHTLWPDLTIRHVLGKRLRGPPTNPNDDPWSTVVGVVGDVHDVALRTPPRPEFNMPVPQTPDGLWPFAQQSLTVVLRATSPETDPHALERPLRRVLASVDPTLPLARVRSMPEYLDESLHAARFDMLLLSVLAGIALALATIGVYGVVSYFVGQRTHEIGVRLALGATPARVWQLVMRRAMTPIIAGILFGGVLSLTTARLLAAELYEIAPTDPATFAAMALLLALTALLAMQGPARRAMRVPPMAVLGG